MNWTNEQINAVSKRIAERVRKTDPADAADFDAFIADEIKDFIRESWQFQEALNDLPECVRGAVDSCHRTVEDLAWLALHEWDLMVEQPATYREDEGITYAEFAKRKRQCERYVRKWMPTKAKEWLGHEQAVGYCPG